METRCPACGHRGCITDSLECLSNQPGYNPPMSKARWIYLFEKATKDKYCYVMNWRTYSPTESECRLICASGVYGLWLRGRGLYTKSTLNAAIQANLKGRLAAAEAQLAALQPLVEAVGEWMKNSCSDIYGREIMRCYSNLPPDALKAESGKEGEERNKDGGHNPI